MKTSLDDHNQPEKSVTRRSGSTSLDNQQNYNLTLKGRLRGWLTLRFGTVVFEQDILDIRDIFEDEKQKSYDLGFKDGSD